MYNNEENDQKKYAGDIQPAYYVRHPDDLYSMADPQPILMPICFEQDIQSASSEFDRSMGNVGDDFVEEEYVHQQ